MKQSVKLTVTSKSVRVSELLRKFDSKLVENGFVEHCKVSGYGCGAKLVYKFCSYIDIQDNLECAFTYQRLLMQVGIAGLTFKIKIKDGE